MIRIRHLLPPVWAAKVNSWLIAVAVLAQSGWAQDGPPPQAVRTDPVREELVQGRRRVTGEVRPARRSQVAVREPGLVLELDVREGQRLEAGALVARIDDRRLVIEQLQLEADRAVAQATLEERRANLELSEWQFQAYSALADRGSSHERELREAKSAIAVAQARAVQAERQLDVLDARAQLVQRRLDDTRITAPFAAIVVKRHAEVGEWLGAGSPVAELIADEAKEAWFEVPEALAPALAQESAAAQVAVAAAGFKQEAEELRVIPSVDARTRTFNLVVPLSGDSTAVHAGMSAIAWIATTATAPQLTIHRDGLLYSDTAAYVYVARKQGPMHVAQSLPVNAMFELGDRVVVEAYGLQAGDLIVTEGNERLFPGQPVSVAAAGN